ncbi:molybdopterin cofactor-binding domain-containing protein [Haliea sp. E17]|uniref:xanthine dehydrogenase family protein molybdopterin-binding subunit n=1 Tax=Haliea sp. E17 TaxID=3401576 RepID=UPI003AAAA25B
MSLSRRKFLIGSGLVGGGLIIGLTLGRSSPPVPGTQEGSFQPNAWLQITTDGRVIFQLHKVEMGQGVMTSLPMLIGEELDFDPARLEIAMAGLHPAFADPAAKLQITGGSTSVAGSWQSLREAGAAARAMLLATAARRWEIPAAGCRTDNGVVINPATGARLAYADLAADAGQFRDIGFQLKSPADYRWIGTSLPRLDGVEKATGRAQFGIDVQQENLKTAVIVRCPHYGGSLDAWDQASISGKPGVVAAFPVHSGVAIVADSYWQARQAAQALQVSWDKGPLANLDSAAISASQAAALASGEARVRLEEGDITQVQLPPGRQLSSRYSAPYTHHSTMEPQNATALYSESAGGPQCVVWAPNQSPDICRAIAAHFAQVPRDQVTVHTTLLGGGFGRRGYPDFVGEVAAIARQMPGVPVKLQWSREDDMQHDFYRPSSLHQLDGGVDEAGHIVSWQHSVVSASIISGLAVEAMATKLPSWIPSATARSLGRKIGPVLADFDPIAADGAEIPYRVSNLRVATIQYDPGIPVGVWRSVSQSYNVFAVESFMDELSHSAGHDPVEFRRRHLPADSRHRAVLELAAARANWGQARAGLAQGVAISNPFGSYCAMVAEVAVDDGSFRVERIVAAVDCGRVINPDGAHAQIEGAIVYGLGAALKAPVTFRDGRAEQSNFHDLPVLRMDEVPEIEVHFVASDEAPTGLGEIGVPAVAPAVANALFAATGQRLRDLPLKLA